MHSSSDAQLVVSDRYRVTAKVGEGSFGAVYSAWDCKLHCPVAIKVTKTSSPARVNRALAEWSAISAINHDSIPRALGSGKLPDGRAFVVIEWCDGVVLEQILIRQRLELGEALALTANIARALDAIHEERLIHRDVKPGNVIVPASAGVLCFARAKLYDFDTCGSLCPTENGDLVMKAGRVSGSPAYMAPEQLLGRQQTRATDIFGLGVLLFELLYGGSLLDIHRPLRTYVLQVGGRPLSVPVNLKRLRSEITIPSDPVQPTEVVEIIVSATRQDPRLRFQSAREMLNRLEHAILELARRQSS